MCVTQKLIYDTMASSDKRLSGKVAVITGASGGIGAGTAQSHASSRSLMWTALMLSAFVCICLL